ncbi:MAG TPA: NADH:flavin oxidoreductase [Acidimicrobiia bacterium]|nr:NADH:flavin oxidoreductase [Acidimicrobiia bacterium]
MRTLRTAAQFSAHVARLGVDLPFAAEVDPAGVLAQPITIGVRRAPNRFAILPMEGWDGTDDGRPTDLVERRWSRFGASGAGLVWGGEAVAVVPVGRANPRQLCIGPQSPGDLASLRARLGDVAVVGLQLTHSGRFSVVPVAAGSHPVLDGRRPAPPITDQELDDLVDDYVRAARIAAVAGFDFVDVKACHGYLVHELLGAVDRPGPYGGDFDGRTRFVRRVIESVRAAVPEVAVGVRLSVFDVVPHRAGADGVGEPEPVAAPYRHAFGGDGSGVGLDLDEPFRLIDALVASGVTMVCVTAGSPYYCPHVQRPAYFPPSDGYTPPEDPLVGVARLVAAAAAVRTHRPDLQVVASGLSYLQEWLPNVAQALVANEGIDFVGLGRMALSYPTLPTDVLAGQPVDRPHLCRTFSDCTTAPRHGLVSGCYPLDEFYKSHPDRSGLTVAKRATRARRG